MYFRFRRYSVVSGKIEAFNDFFLRHLLPIQRKHGAKLVGRWQTEDRGEIVMLWAYDSKESYEAVANRVATDPDSIAAQEYRQRHLDLLYTSMEEKFLVSTVPLSYTLLAHLSSETGEGVETH